MMFVRLAVTCALVCGLLAAGAAGPAAADAAQRKFLKGRTSQKHPVKFARQGNKLDLIRFVARLRCSNGTVLTVYESGFLPTPVRGGKIRDHQIGSTDQVWIRGSVRGNVVRGKIRVTDKLRRGKVRCNSRWFKFVARAG
jgi:hypothetical protein